MFWADSVANEILKSKKYQPYWLDDMFTPSGYPHVGSLRGPLVHDAVYKALRDKGQKVKWTYVMNDFDPIDGLPPELEKDFSKYYGFPVRSVPSPVEGFNSYGEYFSYDIQKVLKGLGVEAEYLSSWDMYHEGKFNEVIKIALDSSEKIQDIYEKISGSKKREKGWFPLQVICEKCGKLGTTRIYDWNGRTVKYTCEQDMVKWAKGCGYSGEISPFDGNGKLPWKVDWPAHWRVMGITIEGAGKDHSSAGGSRDIAKTLCAEVFNCPSPYNLPYEFMLIGGKKMSSSRGLGLKARDLTNMLPLELGRFLFIKTDYKKQVEFEPVGTNAIPVLFDEYQKTAEAYFSGRKDDMARIFELSQTKAIQKPPAIRFSTLAQWVQMPNMDEQIKKDGLEEWAKYARIWIEKYAPERDKFLVQKKVPKEVQSLYPQQKEYLSTFVSRDFDFTDGEKLQVMLYDLTKELGIASKDAFAAIYISLIGKKSGPKAAWLIQSLGKDFIVKRFKEASE